jgi:drug/metabolite transporter (DMT)-like permease
MKKGLVGSFIVVAMFAILLGIFFLLGGDKGQASRSDWFPLVYIAPGMGILLGIFMVADYITTKHEK